MSLPIRIVLGIVAGVLATASPAAGGTLDDVKTRGTLNCGVRVGVVGFATVDEKGLWKGFDVDYCRAIAAASLEDAAKVAFVPVDAGDRTALRVNDRVDVVVGSAAWAMPHDAEPRPHVAAITFYDGQGLMVPKALSITSALELSNASICVARGSAAEVTIAEYFRARKMTYKTVAFERTEDLIAAYTGGRCSALTADASVLYAIRRALAVPADHTVLPEIVAKEAHGLVTRQADPIWADIVRSVHFALLSAEEMGVTAANVERMRSAASPDIRQLLGARDKAARGSGLAGDWAYLAILSVGNYGEIFDRNIGKDAPMGMPRGINALWTNGGLHYAPPMR